MSRFTEAQFLVRVSAQRKFRKFKKEAAWPARGEARIHLEEDPISYFKRARKWRREWRYCQGKVRDQRGQLAGGRGSTKLQELTRPWPGQAPNPGGCPTTTSHVCIQTQDSIAQP